LVVDATEAGSSPHYLGIKRFEVGSLIFKRGQLRMPHGEALERGQDGQHVHVLWRGVAAG